MDGGHMPLALGRAGKPAPAVVLRDYQQTAVADIRAMMARCRRVLFCLSTGGGKTVIFSYITRGAQDKGNSVVIVAHRREIVLQISRALDRMGVEHGVIAPGFTMTTHPVQVAMVQTLARRLHRLREPALLVVDEAHHGVAGQWQKVMQAWQRARVLGVTATPERLDGKGLGDAFDTLVLGPTMQHLISIGALAEYDYLAPPSSLDLSGVHTRGGDYNVDELEAAMAATSIVGDAVEHYARFLNGRPAVAFCISRAHAEAVAEQFRARGWRAAAVDGTMGRAERADLMSGLEEGRLHVLASCDLISEGFDVPVCAGVLLLRPTKSLGLWLQQVGRALRPKPDGSRAVILDHVGNVHQFGMPDLERDWSLAGRKKREKADPVSVCDLCFKTLPAVLVRSKAFDCGGVDDTVCPFKEVKEAVPRAIPEQVGGELQRVDGIAAPAGPPPDWTGGLSLSARGRDWFRLLDRAGVDRERLAEIARARGFRRGWVQHQIAARMQIEDEAAGVVLGELAVGAVQRSSLYRALDLIGEREAAGTDDAADRRARDAIRSELAGRQRERAA